MVHLLEVFFFSSDYGSRTVCVLTQNVTNSRVSGPKKPQSDRTGDRRGVQHFNECTGECVEANPDKDEIDDRVQVETDPGFLVRADKQGAAWTGEGLGT